MFLTLGVVLITLGVNMVDRGQLNYGLAFTLMGIIVLAIGIYLYEKGLIEYLRGELRGG